MTDETEPVGMEGVERQRHDDLEVAAYVAEWLGRRLPVTRLGAGLDHTAWDVDGRLVLRRRLDDLGEEAATVIRREARLLRHVAPISPVPVPEPIHVDPARGVIVHRRLGGSSLLDLGAPTMGAGLPALLGELLSNLHATDAMTATDLAPVDDTPPAAWLDEARDAATLGRRAVPEALRPALDAFLQAAPPPPTERRVLCHADLGAEHLLVDPLTGDLTGVIDWSDAAVADPAVDVARILRDLGPQAYAEVIDHSDQPWDEAADDRARFYARCAALEDLAYGIERHDRRYTDAALDALPRLFARG